MILEEYEFENKWEKEYIEKYIVPFFNKLKKSQNTLDEIFNELDRVKGDFSNEDFSIEVILWDFFNTLPEELRDKMLSEYKVFDENDKEIKINENEVTEIEEKIADFCISLEDWLMEDLFDFFKEKAKQNKWLDFEKVLESME